MKTKFKTLYEFVKKYKQGFMFVFWLTVSCFMASKKKAPIHIHHNYYMCDSVLTATLTGN